MEEREEGRRWRVFRIGDQEHRVDMKAIEPYKRVISHGGRWHCPLMLAHDTHKKRLYDFVLLSSTKAHNKSDG